MIDLLDLLRGLISLRCVNDPSTGLKPDNTCVKGIEEAMRRDGMDPRSLESGGFYTLFDVYGSGKPVILYLAHYDVVPPGPSWSFDPPTSIASQVPSMS